MDRGPIRRANAIGIQRWPLWNNYYTSNNSSNDQNDSSSSNNNNNTGGVEAIFIDPTTIFVCDIEDQSTTGHLVDVTPRKSVDPKEKEQHQQQQLDHPRNHQPKRHDDPRNDASSSLPSDPSLTKTSPPRSTVQKQDVNRNQNFPDNDEKDQKCFNVRLTKSSEETNSCNHHHGSLVLDTTPRPRTESKDSSFPSGIYSEPTIRRGNITAATDVAVTSFDHKSDPTRGSKEVEPVNISPSCKVDVPLKGAAVTYPAVTKTNNVTLEIAQAWVQMGKGGSGEARVPPSPSLKMLPPSSWLCSTNVAMAAASSYRVRRRTLRQLFGGGRATMAASSPSRRDTVLVEEKNVQQRRHGLDHQHEQQQHHHHPAFRLWIRKPIGTTNKTTTAGAATAENVPRRPPSPDFSTNGTTSGSVLVATTAAAVTTTSTTSTATIHRSQSFSVDGSTTTPIIAPLLRSQSYSLDGSTPLEEEDYSLSSSTRCCFHENIHRDSASLQSV